MGCDLLLTHPASEDDAEAEAGIESFLFVDGHRPGAYTQFHHGLYSEMRRVHGDCCRSDADAYFSDGCLGQVQALWQVHVFTCTGFERVIVDHVLYGHRMGI